MKKDIKQPKIYLNYDNPLQNVDVIGEMQYPNTLQEVVVTPDTQLQLRELLRIKSPYGLPSFEEYFADLMEKLSKGKIVNPMRGYKKINLLDQYMLPKYDDGVLPNTNVYGYHDMYNHSFDNPYGIQSVISGEASNVEQNKARMYTSNWNKYRGLKFGDQPQGEAIRDYFDDVSTYFGKGRGYSAFDKLFHTKRYKNAREQWIDNVVLNNPSYGGFGDVQGAGAYYSPMDNSIYVNPNYGRRDTAYLHELTHSRIGNPFVNYNPVYNLVKDIIPYEDADYVSHDYRPSEALANLYEFRAINNLNPGYKFSKRDIRSLRNNIENGMIKDTGLFSSFSNKQIRKLMNKVWDKGKNVSNGKNKKYTV